MIKFFHSLKGLYLGGIETVVMNWYRNIDRSQINFDFGITDIRNDSFSNEIKKYNGKIFIVNKDISAFGKIKYLFNLYKVLKNNGKYEVFFSHEQYLSGFACMIAFLAGIKKRVTVSHLSETYNSNRLKLFSSYIMNYLFVTNRLAVSKKAGISQYGNNLKFDIIHTGIKIDNFKYNSNIRNKIKKELNIENRFIVGNVSRLSKDKNLFFLLEVISELVKLNENIILIQIGCGKLYKDLMDKVKQLKLENNVILCGKKENVYDYYQAMDSFVFPAFNEGLGIVAVEAQCSGLPCFISDGVPDEAIICNTTKIPLSKSAKEWADIILEKTKNFNRKDCSQIVKQAGFDIKDTAKKIESIYLEK